MAGFRLGVHFEGWTDVRSVVIVIVAVIRAPHKLSQGVPTQTSRSKGAHLVPPARRISLILLGGQLPRTISQCWVGQTPSPPREPRARGRLRCALRNPSSTTARLSCLLRISKGQQQIHLKKLVPAAPGSPLLPLNRHGERKRTTSPRHPQMLNSRAPPLLLHSTAQSGPCPRLAGCHGLLDGASASIPPSSIHPTKGRRGAFLKNTSTAWNPLLTSLFSANSHWFINALFSRRSSSATPRLGFPLTPTAPVLTPPYSIHIVLQRLDKQAGMPLPTIRGRHR